MLRVFSVLKVAASELTNILQDLNDPGIKSSAVVRPWLSKRILGRIEFNCNIPPVQTDFFRHRAFLAPLIAAAILESLQRHATV